MGATFLDENGRTQPMIMGCYGIGVSRTLAAVAEQYNDENGFIWPVALSPFDIHVIPVNVKKAEQRELAESVYSQLRSQKITALYDDRDERPGVKFADSDLIGLPIRITVGKRASEGIVELKVRKTGETLEVNIENLYDTIREIIVQ